MNIMAETAKTDTSVEKFLDALAWQKLDRSLFGEMEMNISIDFLKRTITLHPRGSSYFEQVLEVSRKGHIFQVHDYTPLQGFVVSFDDLAIMQRVGCDTIRLRKKEVGT